MKTKEKLEADKLAAKSGSQLAGLWPAVVEDFTLAFNRLETNQIEILTESVEEEDYCLRRATKLSSSSEQLFDEQPLYDIQASPSLEQPILFAASSMKRHVGTLTHSWLEQIADNIEQWPVERIHQQQQIFSNQLQQLGVASADLAKAVELVTINLQQTLTDPQGIHLLSQHQDSASEIALERFEEGEFKSYIIDRSFIDEDGTRWIVDYKTSTHQGAGRDDFLSDQKQHYQEQLENYASLFAELETCPIKLVLYFTSYQKLISWQWQKDKS